MRNSTSWPLCRREKHNLDVPKLQACLKAQDEKAVRASMREGDNLGVDATPTMFVNGQKLDGAVPAEDVRVALDQALKDAGVAPPEHKQLNLRSRWISEHLAIGVQVAGIANRQSQIRRIAVVEEEKLEKS